MRISTLLYGLAAAALLTGFSTANAAHDPSPCATGQPGAGTNCMYLTTSGNVYDGVSGNRSADTGLSFGVGVWIDFRNMAVQGGGFDIVFETTNVASMNWVWGADFPAGEQTLSGSQTVNGWEGIQFDDFAGNGYGGTTGTQDGWVLVGTLEVTLASAGFVDFGIAQPYGTGTFPNCFAPGANSGGGNMCVPTNFYNLGVTAAVPVPAAVWLMLTGLGSMLGFSRKKVA